MIRIQRRDRGGATKRQSGPAACAGRLRQPPRESAGLRKKIRAREVIEGFSTFLPPPSPFAGGAAPGGAPGADAPVVGFGPGFHFRAPGSSFGDRRQNRDAACRVRAVPGPGRGFLARGPFATPRPAGAAAVTPLAAEAGGRGSVRVGSGPPSPSSLPVMDSDQEPLPPAVPAGLEQFGPGGRQGGGAGTTQRLATGNGRTGQVVPAGLKRPVRPKTPSNPTTRAAVRGARYAAGLTQS